MKLRLSFLLVILIIFLIAGCKSTESIVLDKQMENIVADGIIDIKEKMFVTQINDIYVNSADYIGKTIMLEGIFTSYYNETSGVTYRMVTRYGPGCCGTDSNPGFEVLWKNDNTYPNENDWVEATGILESYVEDGTEYLQLDLISLTILQDRGEEYVNR